MDDTFDVCLVLRPRALRRIAVVNYCYCLAFDTNQLGPLFPLNTVVTPNDVMHTPVNRRNAWEIQLMLKMREK